MQCFREFPVAKKSLDKKVGGGISSFSVEYFLSNSTETFRSGTFLCCFREFLVAKELMEKKGLERRTEKFRRIFFGLKKPKSFVGERLVFH